MIPHTCLDEIVTSRPRDHVTLTVPAFTNDPQDFPTRVVIGITDIPGRTVYPYRVQELRPAGPVTMLVEEDDIVGPARGQTRPLEYVAVVALQLALQPVDLCAELGETPSSTLVGQPPELVAWLERARPQLSCVRADLERLRLHPLVDERTAVAALTMLYGLSWEPDRVSSDKALTARAKFALHYLPGGPYRRRMQTSS